MNQKLPIFIILKHSFEYIIKNIQLIGCFYIFAFAGIYIIQRFNASQNLLAMLGYLAYTYFFYYFFVSSYGKQKPLFNKQHFNNSLIRIFAILLLAFAALLLVKIFFQILFFLVASLKVFPEFYEEARSSYLNLIGTPYFQWLIYAAMFVALSFIFFIPAFAWISAVIGRDSSITATFAKTKGNYLRLIFLFLLIYGILPFITILFFQTSTLLLSAVSTLMTIIQIVTYLKIYEFFYKE